jgi:hypothetical protein
MFAEKHNVIPNTTTAFETMKEKFSIPEDHISEVGQATFDYDFYAIMNNAMTSISKANAEKYYDTSVTPAVMYSFDHFMGILENNLVAGKVL